MPWREQHADGFTLHLDPVRWKDHHAQTVQYLRGAHAAGNIWLFGKSDTQRVVEAALRLHPTYYIIRVLLMYDDLREAIGDDEINRLIALQREHEERLPE